MADYLIAFKYLKSAIGLIKRKLIKPINWFELISIPVFLVCFLTSQSVIVHYAIHRDFTAENLIKSILDGDGIPSWIHSLIVFNLWMLIAVLIIVTVVLVVALYYIRTFSKNSND